MGILVFCVPIQNSGSTVSIVFVLRCFVVRIPLLKIKKIFFGKGRTGPSGLGLDGWLEVLALRSEFPTLPRPDLVGVLVATVGG